MTTNILPSFKVTTKDGIELKVGDKLKTFRGETVVFDGCYHPRKIVVLFRIGRRLQKHGFGSTLYPSVCDVTIIENEVGLGY